MRSSARGAGRGAHGSRHAGMLRSAIALCVLLPAIQALAENPSLDADVIFAERNPGVKAGHYYSNFGYGWEGVRNVEGRPVGNDLPYAMFSSASPLMNKIDGRHHDARLTAGAYGDLEGWQRPTSRFSRHTIFNLTQPEKSLVLMSPLAKAAGGCAEGRPEQMTIKEDRAHAPKAVVHPVIFESADDADYRSILAHVRAAGRRLDEIKRFDMPGFKPNEQ